MLLGFLYLFLHSSHLSWELLQKLKFFATTTLRKAQSSCPFVVTNRPNFMKVSSSSQGLARHANMKLFTHDDTFPQTASDNDRSKHHRVGGCRR